MWSARVLGSLVGTIGLALEPLAWLVRQLGPGKASVQSRKQPSSCAPWGYTSEMVPYAPASASDLALRVSFEFDFRVDGLRCVVRGLRFRVWGSGSEVWG